MKDFINVRFLSIQETAGHASHTYKSTIAVTFLTEILGMSFREYLMMSQKMDVPVYPLNEILNNRVNLPVEHPLPLFKKYLQAGYYPFYEEPGYDQRLQNALNQTLEVDIPVFAGMNVSTARKLKQLLYIVAQSVPFKP
ncbi:MAG: hypothetical protein LBU22_11590, partial [Dysgonamonadaceae bacterium]|nr:hypothetical protein [Dysgonamonadaceae bacterium]